MHEPDASARPFALLAVFSRPTELMEAVERTRKAGYTVFDACSPFPIDGLRDTMGLRDARVGWWTLAGGVAGALSGYAMLIYTNLDYPIDIGGRPLIAFPAFTLIAFELAVIGATFASIIAMLMLNGLPRLHHPLFGRPEFSLADADSFFLVLFGNDPQFDARRSRAFLKSLHPLLIEMVRPAESRT